MLPTLPENEPKFDEDRHRSGISLQDELGNSLVGIDLDELGASLDFESSVKTDVQEVGNTPSLMHLIDRDQVKDILNHNVFLRIFSDQSERDRSVE